MVVYAAGVDFCGVDVVVFDLVDGGVVGGEAEMMLALHMRIVGSSEELYLSEPFRMGTKAGGGWIAWIIRPVLSNR